MPDRLGWHFRCRRLPHEGLPSGGNRHRRRCNCRFECLQIFRQSVTPSKKGSKIFVEILLPFRIVDYSKCPSCHSSNLSLLEDGEDALTPPATPAAVPSAADELKKFKELLDSGIIAQEEFDAKKKHLLGL